MVSQTNSIIRTVQLCNTCRMMFWTQTAIVAVLVATTTAFPDCPSPWFDVSFIALIDQVLPANVSFLLPDPNSDFYTDILGFTQSEADDAKQDAMDFFDTKYGLDFSQSQPDVNGCRQSNNALFCPFVVNPIVQYEITVNKYIKNGKTKTRCYKNRDGTFLVTFTGPETLHGTYGGATGKPANPGDSLAWGFYGIFTKPNKPLPQLIIHFESGTPLRAEPVDGYSVVNCDLSHPILGQGVAQGVTFIVPEGPSSIRYSGRLLFTFPKHP